MEEVVGSAEEFIKDNIKKKKVEREKTKTRGWGEAGEEKSNLFMIHHIDSPRQLVERKLG